MCQGKTPKWWGAFSRCLRVNWSKILEIREKKHIIEWKIVVNFSAYKYICKNDDSVQYSKHHPSLNNVTSYRTNRPIQPYWESRKSYVQENPRDVPSKKHITESKIHEMSHPIWSHRIICNKRYISGHWRRTERRTERFGSLCPVQVQ